jgi:hypothetical protein
VARMGGWGSKPTCKESKQLSVSMSPHIPSRSSPLPPAGAATQTSLSTEELSRACFKANEGQEGQVPCTGQWQGLGGSPDPLVLKSLSSLPCKAANPAPPFSFPGVL